MPTPTPNLLLQKAAAGENYDLDLTNENLDKIDAAVGNRLRLDDPFGHIGRTAGFQTINGVDVGVIITAAQELRGMVFETSSAGRLVIPKTGKYEIRTKIYATGGAAAKFGGGAFVNSVPIVGTTSVSWKGDTNDYITHTTVTYDLNENDRIGLGMTFTSSTWGTDGYNGSWLEVKYVGEVS
ncbi:hypothetical protein FDG92_gp05 [Arthrobacter phage Jasmine]|uniref:Minor tail protein n=1 Tax=Arthrobacter phage Jasmine TaxID=1772302 RepID=A0A0U4B3F2_9CAUD|nr:hypothetical protein FDG92_gp05 [Arthrobacter phage Jasmine]ALY09277.1 minor tail protein [Arthrobacter phage Jasmine]